MLPVANIALHFDRAFVAHGNYDVVIIFAAFSAAGLDRVADRKRGALHSGTPLLGLAKIWPIKTREIAGIYGAGSTIDVSMKLGTTVGSLHSVTLSPYGLKGDGNSREDQGERVLCNDTRLAE